MLPVTMVWVNLLETNTNPLEPLLFLCDSKKSIAQNNSLKCFVFCLCEQN